MKNYKIIFFDVDDTLFDYQKSERDAFLKTSLDFNLPFNEENFALYRKINSKMWKDLEKGLITKEEIKYKRFDDFFSSIGVSADCHDVGRTYVRHLSQASYLLDGALELCSVLHGKGLEMIFLTNGIQAVQEGRILKSPIMKYFNCMVVSEEAKSFKPEAAIFEYALKKSGLGGKLGKSEMLIVGDNPTADIAGGINFGIDTLWVNVKGIKKPENINPTYTVNTISELSSLMLEE